ncbi:MAG: hypothetical protein LBP39_00650 [Rickettsiales bacterium]|jgi:hypothetical protein|nr:hypothetical protein [Rickettsiales bacterium]
MSDNEENSYKRYREKFIDQYANEIVRFTQSPTSDQRSRILNSKDIAVSSLGETLDIIWSSRAIEPRKDIEDDDIFFETDLHGDMRAFLSTLCENGAVKYKDGEDALIFYNPDKVGDEQDKYTLGELEALKNSNETKFKEEHEKLMRKLQPLANVEPTERYSRYINCGDFMDRGNQSEQMIHMVNYLYRQCKEQKKEPAKLIMGNHELFYLDGYAMGYVADGKCIFGHLRSISKQSDIFKEKATSLEKAVKEAVASGALTLAYGQGTTLFSHGVITKKMKDDLEITLSRLERDMKSAECRERNAEIDRLQTVWTRLNKKYTNKQTKKEEALKIEEDMKSTKEAEDKVVLEGRLLETVRDLEKNRLLKEDLREQKRKRRTVEEDLNKLKEEIRQDKALNKLTEEEVQSKLSEEEKLEETIEDMLRKEIGLESDIDRQELFMWRKSNFADKLWREEYQNKSKEEKELEDKLSIYNTDLNELRIDFSELRIETLMNKLAEKEKLEEDLMNKLAEKEKLEEAPMNELAEKEKLKEDLKNTLAEKEKLKEDLMEKVAKKGKYKESLMKKVAEKEKLEEVLKDSMLKQDNKRVEKETELREELYKLIRERRGLTDSEIADNEFIIKKIGELVEKFHKLDRISIKNDAKNYAKNIAECLNDFLPLRSKIFKDFDTLASLGLCYNKDTLEEKRNLFNLMNSGNKKGITWKSSRDIEWRDLIKDIKHIVGHDPELADILSGRVCNSDMRFAPMSAKEVILADCLRSSGYNKGVTKANYAVIKPQFLLGENFAALPKTEKKQITKGDSAIEAEKVYSKYLENLAAIDHQTTYPSVGTPVATAVDTMVATPSDKEVPIEKEIAKEKNAAGAKKSYEKFLENGPQNKESWRQQLSNESQEPKDNTMGGPGGV